MYLVQDLEYVNDDDYEDNYEDNHTAPVEKPRSPPLSVGLGTP